MKHAGGGRLDKQLCSPSLFTTCKTHLESASRRAGASLRHVSAFKGHPKFLAPSLIQFVSCFSLRDRPEKNGNNASQHCWSGTCPDPERPSGTHAPYLGNGRLVP